MQSSIRGSHRPRLLGLILALAFMFTGLTAAPAQAATVDGGSVNCYYSYENVHVTSSTFQTTYQYAPSHVVIYAAYHSTYQSRSTDSTYNTVSSWKVTATQIELAGTICD